MKSKHQKHAKLPKPFTGLYHRNEWEIIGPNCKGIKALVHSLAEGLENYSSAYLDASHTTSEEPKKLSEFISSISGFDLSSSEELNQYNSKAYFSSADLLFINGNHFRGSNQILVLDETRFDKLKGKLDILNNVRLVVLKEAGSEIPDFLKEKLEGNGDIETLRIDETDRICSFISKELAHSSPELYGLVLSGGKSTRMGKDKASIVYYEKEQSEHEADMLNEFCSNTFISCRTDQLEDLNSEYAKIEDGFIGLGPFGGILSAFREYPDKAFLTLACDLPFITKEIVEILVANRDPGKLATCFYNPDTDFPEPLITIWEPRAYPVMLQFLAQGYSCPRKVLINSDVKLIKEIDKNAFFNVNTESDFLETQRRLEG